MFTKQKNVSKEQSLLEKSKKNYEQFHNNDFRTEKSQH